MKDKLFSFLSFLIHFTIKKLLWFEVRFGRSKQYVIDRCVFCGDQPFLTLCKSAMMVLKALDEQTFNALTQMREMTFFSHKDMFDGPPGLYSISEPFCSWLEKGIIVRLVYSLYFEEQISCKVFCSEKKRERARALAKAKLVDWLDKHKFPDALVQIYREVNHKPENL